MAINENVVEKKQNGAKEPYKHAEPVITDLNILIAQMIMAGKSKTQCAKELKVSPATITHHVNRFRDLVVLKDSGDIADPINNERARLAKKFNKINRVVDYNLKNYKNSHACAKLAWETGRDIYKGSGVFADHTETHVESFEDKRLTVVHKLELATQYGAEIPEAIQAEFEMMGDIRDKPVDSNNPEIASKQAPNTDNDKPT